MADKQKVDQLMDLGNKVARSTVAVVDAITQRGGFKGEELSTIGTLRDQAVQLVQAVETMQADAEFEEDEEEEAAA
jgi:predicted transcriptional regulator